MMHLQGKEGGAHILDFPSIVGQFPKISFDQGGLCQSSPLLSLDAAKISLAIIFLFIFRQFYATKFISLFIVCIGFICLHIIYMFNTEILGNIEKQNVKRIHYPITWR